MTVTAHQADADCSRVRPGVRGGTGVELGPDRVDVMIAVGVGLVVLALYARTLAPDVLYSDSAEFQTLAYTLGTTHTTGYPIYLLLARLVGFLPLGVPAWRVSLVSALGAAITVAGVYTLTRFVARNRLGALLGSLALALSSTLWSQAVIAEVYTPATAFLVAIFNLLALWRRDQAHRRWALFLATALTCLGLGVHASVPLVAPAAVLFVLVSLGAASWSGWRRTLAAATGGFVLGLGLYFLAFALLDLHDPPSSFIRVMLYPSRSIWGLQAADLDSVLKRWWITVTGLQWRPVMFPESQSFADALVQYGRRVVDHEFSLIIVVFALWGQWEMRRTAPRLHSFLLISYVVMLGFILNYHPGDKYVFYLPTYLFLSTSMGAGMGAALNLAAAHLPGRDRRYAPEAYIVVLVVTAVTLLPHAGSRWDALQAGKATFATDTYPYPVEDLMAPRQLATLRLHLLPDDVVLVMNWRALYTMAYLAHVEGLRPNLRFMEATPYGSEGQMADSLVAEMVLSLEAGYPVFVDEIYPGLRERFRVMPAPGGTFYRLSIP